MAKTFKFAGQTLTAKEIAEQTGISASKISFQMGRGGCKTINQAFKKIGLDEDQQAKVSELTGKEFKPAKESTGTRGRPAMEQQSVRVDIASGKYLIVRRAKDSDELNEKGKPVHSKHTISIYKGVKEVADRKEDSAKAVLKEIITEKNLDVQIEGKNTRTIGKHVIEALQAK